MQNKDHMIQKLSITEIGKKISMHAQGFKCELTKD